MAWNMDDSRPIYLQLMEQIEIRILSGAYKPGERLPSVRELAMEAAVNPNTMQKALAELERSGLIYARRTSGRFVADDHMLLDDLKRKLASKHMEQYLDAMRSIGYTHAEACALLTARVDTK